MHTCIVLYQYNIIVQYSTRSKWKILVEEVHGYENNKYCPKLFVCFLQTCYVCVELLTLYVLHTCIYMYIHVCVQTWSLVLTSATCMYMYIHVGIYYIILIA